MFKIDPKLSQALEQTVDPVKVVIALDSEKPLGVQETEESVARLVAKTEKKTHKSPIDIEVHKYIQSFSIKAEPGFMKALLNEKGIAGVILREG